MFSVLFGGLIAALIFNLGKMRITNYGCNLKKDLTDNIYMYCSEKYSLIVYILVLKEPRVVNGN